VKRALISVYDKSGLIELARGLVDLGWELVSTGGTAAHLREHQLPVTDVSSVTEFPEIMAGRVKTLHPRIFGGILARDREDDVNELESIGGSTIDLVICNLYPFHEAMRSTEANEEDCIEMIDIGGPSMVRAAAKNFQRTAIVCDPKDYSLLLDKLQQGNLNVEYRKHLAAKAFAATAFYDSLISGYLGLEDYPETMTASFSKIQDLRYGENPHQNAAFYADAAFGQGIVQAEQLQGKELSFNNIFDADAAWQMASAYEQPCAAAVKHTNPCGLALGRNVEEAYQRAHDADPVSIFGGIIALNRPVTGAAAEAMAEIFLEIIIAPDFDQEALQVLGKKKNLRLLRLAPGKSTGKDWKRVSGGLLIQDRDTAGAPESLQVKAGPQLSDKQWDDLMFAWTAVRFVKSNAIVLCRDSHLIGVGAGQMNRVQSMELALKQAGQQAQGACVASDAFFPFADSIERAAAAGVTAVIEPGGSRRDQEVIDACNHHGISLVFTGMRHFRH